MKRFAGGPAPAAIGGIVWRRHKGDLQLLMGKRRKEPERDCLTICFGGAVTNRELGIMSGFATKINQEVGGELKLFRETFLEHYGPSDHKYEPVWTSREHIKVREWRKTKIRVMSSRVIVVFFAQLAHGEFHDNPSVSNLGFINLLDCARISHQLAFDQSHMLADLFPRLLRLA